MSLPRSDLQVLSCNARVFLTKAALLVPRGVSRVNILKIENEKSFKIRPFAKSNVKFNLVIAPLTHDTKHQKSIGLDLTWYRLSRLPCLIFTSRSKEEYKI
jgi:hypothetical protein